MAKISGFVVLLPFITPENVHSYIPEESQHIELDVLPEIKNHTGISEQYWPHVSTQRLLVKT
jgi:hypothetical protein